MLSHGSSFCYIKSSPLTFTHTHLSRYKCWSITQATISAHLFSLREDMRWRYLRKDLQDSSGDLCVSSALAELHTFDAELKPAGRQTSTSTPPTGSYCSLIIPAVYKAAGGWTRAAEGFLYRLSRRRSSETSGKPFIRPCNYIIVWMIEVNRCKWPRLLIIYEDQTKPVAGRAFTHLPSLQGFTRALYLKLTFSSDVTFTEKTRFKLARRTLIRSLLQW